MNKQKINKRIHIALGWELGVPNRLIYPSKTGNKRLVKYSMILPDYYGDLNAMYEAEEWLRKNNQLAWEYYDTALDKITKDETGVSYPWHATSAQRAVAFLSVIEDLDSVLEEI